MKLHALAAGLIVLTLADPVAGQAERPAAPPSPAPSVAPAGPPAPARPPAIVRVFEIRHADMGEVALVLPTLLSGANVLTVDGTSRTVTVVDQPEFVARVESWLAQFDVPPDTVLVRIVLQKAERSGTATREVAGDAWRYRELAETTVEVAERGHVTQALGTDGAFEIHVRLGSVDAEQGLLHFDEVAIRRRDDTPGRPPSMRDVFSTSMDARNRVGKVVMATRDPAADEALVLRLLALIREREGD